jgi:hypothetical protein
VARPSVRHVERAFVAEPLRLGRPLGSACNGANLVKYNS